MARLTVGEMKARNEANGGNWFSKGAMKFFGTKIEGQPNTKGFFITSENNFNGTKRLYTIRKFDQVTGNVETVGEFQAYETKAEAREVMKAL